MPLILTETSNPDTADIDLMTPYEIARAINNEDKKVAVAVETQLESIGRGIDAIAKAFLAGGRLAYFGAGTSGRLGVLDASEMWPTFGVEHGLFCAYIAGGDGALRYSIENSEDSAEMALADLADFKPTVKDVVVAVSASGNPLYVVTVLEMARAAGCATVAITCNPAAKMKAFADIFICAQVGPEAITGSSRMKAGTAQKLILNMLSTGAMIRIGKTYKNYMVDVRALNEKLVERAVRFVSEIAGVGVDEAARQFAASGNSVKVAAAMAKRGVGADEARALLAAAGGILRKAIG